MRARWFTVVAVVVGVSCTEESLCPEGFARVEGVCDRAADAQTSPVRDPDAEVTADGGSEAGDGDRPNGPDGGTAGDAGAVDAELPEAGADGALRDGGAEGGNDADVQEDAGPGCEAPEDANMVGAPCSNGQMGQCARLGQYVCDDAGKLVCEAAQVAPVQEVCGDLIDNDCDGEVDDVETWFLDCDDDGYPSDTGEVQQSCEKPAPLDDTCLNWTLVAPTDGQADCADWEPDVHPGADWGFRYQDARGLYRGDRNCDGQTEVSLDLTMADGGPVPPTCPEALILIEEGPWPPCPAELCVFVADDYGGDYCDPGEDLILWGGARCSVGSAPPNPSPTTILGQGGFECR